jgi:hypothetical protein
MAEEFLSEAWLELLGALGAELPEHEGATMVIQHEIAGAPAGKVRFHLVWVNGRLETAALGKHRDPDIVVQAKAAEALKILNGDMDPHVAYMQGRLKVDGDYRKFIVDLRQWRAGAPYQGMWDQVAANTAS